MFEKIVKGTIVVCGCAALLAMTGAAGYSVLMVMISK
jgi:hypothetical protein